MEQTYKGLWFLNEDISYSSGKPAIEKDKCVSGTLTIKENGSFLLETLGGLQNTPIDANFTINGNTSDGKVITLFDCLDLNSQWHLATLLNNCSYLANSVAVTESVTKYCYLKSRDEIKIEKLTFNSFNLNNWMWNSNFVFDEKRLMDKPSLGKGIHIDYKTPPTDEGVQIDSNHKLKFVTSVTISSIKIAETQMSITEKNYIEISGEDLSLNNTIEKMYEFLDFLSLGVGESESPQEVAFYSDSVRFDYYFNKARAGLEKNVYPPKMLFTRHQIWENREVILKTWFNSYNRMSDILLLFFTIVNNKERDITARFLSLVQFLESYHRRTNPVPNSKIAEWKQLLEIAFSDSITKSQKNNIKQRLAHGYEPTLKERLLKLVENFTIFEFITPKISSKDFVEKVKNTRNYLTHYGKKPNNVIDDNVEYYEVCEVLDQISRFYILQLAGFPSKAATALLKEHLYLSAISIR